MPNLDSVAGRQNIHRLTTMLLRELVWKLDIQLPSMVTGTCLKFSGMIKQKSFMHQKSTVLVQKLVDQKIKLKKLL